MQTVDQDIQHALKALSLVLSYGVATFDEYGTNYPGLITLPASAGPMPEPIKLEHWSVAKFIAVSRGWIVVDGSHVEVTTAGKKAASSFTSGTFTDSLNNSKIAREFWVAVAAAATFIESLKTITGW